MSVRYTFGSNRYGKLGRFSEAEVETVGGYVSVEASDGHQPAVASIALGSRQPQPVGGGIFLKTSRFTTEKNIYPKSGARWAPYQL